MPLKVCLVGAMGKMGRVIADTLFHGDFSASVAIMVDPRLAEDGSKELRAFKDIKEIKDSKIFDVVIDFSTPLATMESAAWCMQNKMPMVSGTTGLSKEQLDKLKVFAKSTPIFWSPNMSLGVNLIDALLPQIAEVLQGFEVEIVEIHHGQKKDYPSGTALRFAETLIKLKDGEIIFGRAKGKSDNRPLGEVVVHAIRGGTVPGEHTIYFLGPDEVIEITHRALSRKIFALGAIKAAEWVISKKIGFYNMNDVLGL